MGSQFGITLFRFELGEVFLVTLAVVFSYLFGALLLVAAEFVRSVRVGVLRRQQLSVLVGLALPVLTSFVQTVLTVPIALTPISFAATGGILAVSIFWYELFDIVPIARQRVFQYVDAGVLVIGQDRRIIHANPTAQRMFGSGDSLDESLDALDDSLLEADPSDSRDPVRCEISRSDGATRTYEVERAPIFDGHNRLDASVLLFYDGAELESQKQELERQRDQLEETTVQLERQNERLDRFATVVSHDLRNPLSIAKTYHDLSQKTGRADDFEEVANAHDRMETMIDEVLSLARTDTALEESDFETVALNSLVEEAWRITATDGATLESDIQQGRSIEAKPDLLRNVLENLFRNAADHNEAPVTVTVSTTGSTGFYVEDDGSGIPEGKRTDVFEHGYTTSETGGGLVLFIVEELVSLTGGGFEPRRPKTVGHGSRLPASKSLQGDLPRSRTVRDAERLAITGPEGFRHISGTRSFRP